MSPASRRAPQGATTPVLPLVDWHPYEYALSWLERVRAPLEDSGGCTAADQHLINAHACALLVVATSPLDEPIVLPVPERAPAGAGLPRGPRP
jgi:hypothetical protein